MAREYWVNYQWFDGEVFIDWGDDGDGPPLGATWFYDTPEEREADNPKLATICHECDTRSQLNSVNKQYGIENLEKIHAAKAREADMVKYHLIVDLNRLPFLAADLALRDSSCSLLEIAEEVLAKHSEAAANEAQRVHQRRIIKQANE